MIERLSDWFLKLLRAVSSGLGRRACPRCFIANQTLMNSKVTSFLTPDVWTFDDAFTRVALRPPVLSAYLSHRRKAFLLHP